MKLFKNRLMVLGFIALFSVLSKNAQATTCQYPEIEKFGGVQKFIKKTMPELSCHFAMRAASECKEGKNLKLHEEALLTCDQELARTAQGKYQERALAEIEILKAARTQCFQSHDSELEKIYCQLELSDKQIRTLNPQSQSAQDSSSHQGQ